MLSWNVCSISAKVRSSSSEERSNLIAAPQALPLLVTDSFILLLSGQTQAAVRVEAEEYLLPRDEGLEMVGLDTDLVAPDADAAFEEIAEIDGINDLSLKQIVGTRAVRLAQMN